MAAVLHSARRLSAAQNLPNEPVGVPRDLNHPVVRERGYPVLPQAPDAAPSPPFLISFPGRAQGVRPLVVVVRRLFGVVTAMAPVVSVRVMVVPWRVRRSRVLGAGWP